jgi:acetyl-CoA carboxylase biotin carboxyl carrier protein
VRRSTTRVIPTLVHGNESDRLPDARIRSASYHHARAGNTCRAASFPLNSDMARIEIKSEITGTVWQVKSSPGDKVESGDTLVVVESMKMEIPVITEDAGTVKEILVKEKDPVAEGQVVAVIEG